MYIITNKLTVVMFSFTDIVYNAKILNGKAAVSPAISPIGYITYYGDKSGVCSQVRQIEDGCESLNVLLSK